MSRPAADLAAPDALLQLPDVLAWNAAAMAFARAWHRAYGDFLAARWQALAADAPPQDAAIFQAMALLEAGERERLLRTPWFADGLTRRGPPHLAGDRVARWLLAQLAATGHEVPDARGQWLCRGDARIGLRGELIVESPAVAGLCLDEASDARFPHREHGGNDIVPLAASERCLGRQRVAAAVGALGRPEAAPRELVLRFTEVLALRADREQPGVFRSGTFDRYVGLTLLTNPHLPRVDTEALANALVHEAIHHLLFVTEVLYGRFVATEDTSALHVDSPWTGTRLRLESYVHACLVWYGLYWLWQGVIDGGDGAGLDAARAVTMRALCRRGFTARPVTARLAPLRGHLSGGVFAVLEEVESRMVREP